MEKKTDKKEVRYQEIYRLISWGFVLEQCAGQGHALGSGNTITDHVKVGNYLAMLNKGRKFRK